MDIAKYLRFLPIKRFRNPPPRVAVLRLSGAIGSLGPLRQGLTLAGLEDVIARAFALPRLSAALKGPQLWIKRDDQTGLAFGGNKTRKLEYLLADARAQGAEMLITRGARQSNHCRQTAAAVPQSTSPTSAGFPDRSPSPPASR